MAEKKAPENRKKLVKIRVPRLPGKSKEEQVLLVGHNFKNYRIRRGVDVLVPEAVARRIEQAERAQEESDSYAQRMAQTQ